MKTIRIILKTCGFLAFVGLYTFVAMTLWNHLIPQLFHLPVISFWQTIGLIVLLKMLLLGHGWGRGCHGGKHKKFRKRGKMWKKHFKARMQQRGAFGKPLENE